MRRDARLDILVVGIEAMVDRVESHLVAVREGCTASSGAGSPRLHPWEDASVGLPEPREPNGAAVSDRIPRR